MAAKIYPDFGKWLTYKEAIYSATAVSKGIDNTPTQEEYNRMVMVYRYVYAPLCEHFKCKIPVSSFFRSKALNSKIKGASSTSDHMMGGAIDLDCRKFSNPLTNDQVFEYVREGGVPFDQLIFESPDGSNKPRWVHIGYRPSYVGGNRNRIMLGQLDSNGNMYYEFWPWGEAANRVANYTGIILGLIGAAAYYFTRNSA